MEYKLRDDRREQPKWRWPTVFSLNMQITHQKTTFLGSAVGSLIPSPVGQQFYF